jgi:hypothetical protein
MWIAFLKQMANEQELVCRRSNSGGGLLGGIPEISLLHPNPIIIIDLQG